MALFTLNDHIVQHLQSGCPIQVGTRNAFNKTAYSRSWGCKVNDDRQSVILFLYRNYCDQALQNIRDNGLYSAAFINVHNYEAYQLKGSRARILDNLAPFRAVLEHYQQSQVELVANISLPPIAVDNMADRSLEDYVPIFCPIEECYRQTPGPGAGEPVEKS